MSEQQPPQATYGPSGPEVWVMTPSRSNVEFKAILHAVSGEQALVEVESRLLWVSLSRIDVRRIKHHEGDIGTSFVGRVATSGA